MQGHPYLVAAVMNPLSTEVEARAALSTVICGPVLVVARDERDAAVKMALQETALKGANLDRVEFLVRPF